MCICVNEARANLIFSKLYLIPANTALSNSVYIYIFYVCGYVICIFTSRTDNMSHQIDQCNIQKEDPGLVRFQMVVRVVFEYC